MARFKDQRETIDSFQNEFLVKCPHCHSCATVRRMKSENPDELNARRFSCQDCGSSKDWSGRASSRSWPREPADSYFHYPLWLQMPCCGEILWAYNLQHLEFLEAFVRAEMRERELHQHYGWANSSLCSRLPKWIQSRQNREPILKAIMKIRKLV